MLIGQTGNVPPISSVQPQQCHLVGFPHITQHRTALNGSCMGLLWCFESGRMGFALKIIVTFDYNSFMKRKYQTPTFFRMKLWCLIVTHGTLGQSFDQRQTSLHILKGKPKKHHAYEKYSMREARLTLIEIYGPSVPCVTTRHHNRMQKNVGV